MWSSLRQRFGTLRWKLAGSYVLVTLLVVLVLETLLLVVIAAPVSNAVLPIAGNVLGRQLADELRPALVTPGRDEAQIAQILRDFTTTTRSSPNGPISFNSDDVALVLLDPAGRVITGTQQFVEAINTPLADVEPSAREVVEQTRASGTEATANARLGLRSYYLSTAPVLNDDGQLLGMVYVRFPAVGFNDFAQGLALFLLISAVAILMGSGFVGLIFGLIAGRGFSRRLKRLTVASAAMAGGDLEQRVHDRSADEIGQLARQLNTMAAQLDENMRALRLLADQNAQLAEQATQLATVEERNRLARDLHDSVSQELFSLTMQSAAARRLVATKPEQAATQLGEIQATAQQALQETRSLIFALRPAQLDGRGLGPALRDLQTAARERQGLEIDVRIGGERRLPLEYEQALFRIVQEALANVVRHSGARSADVDLQYTDHTVRVVITDHGDGFDIEAPRNARSIGLDSMRERAAALGGTLMIESAPDQGTTVNVCLPAPLEY